MIFYDDYFKIGDIVRVRGSRRNLYGAALYIVTRTNEHKTRADLFALKNTIKIFQNCRMHNEYGVATYIVEE